MSARIIVAVTVAIAWALNLFLFANTGQENLRLLLPATGGYYPGQIESGGPDYHPIWMMIWLTGELATFVIIGIIAVYRRSTVWAVACCLLWLGSIALGILRFKWSMDGIH